MIETEIVETGDAQAEVMSAAEARERTEHLKRHLTNAWFELRQLYVGCAWVALGFHSWDAYVKSEFGTLQLTPPPAERLAVMVDMRNAGMSNRAIATATGTSDRTVRRELEGADLPDDTTVFGPDGKRYDSTRPKPRVDQVPVDQWRRENGLGDPDSGVPDASTFHDMESGAAYAAPDSTGRNDSTGWNTGEQKRQDVLSDELDIEALKNEDPATGLGITPFVHDPNAPKPAPKKRPAPGPETTGVQGELFSVEKLAEAGTEVLRLAGLIQLSKADRSQMDDVQRERYRNELTQAMELLMDELDTVAEVKQ